MRHFFICVLLMSAVGMFADEPEVVYRKITSTDELTEGEYLIAHVEGNEAWLLDGSATTQSRINENDGEDNIVCPAIIEGEYILKADAYRFRIQASASYPELYNIISVDGHKVGNTGTAGTVNYSTTSNYVNDITFTDDGDVRIEACGTTNSPKGLFLRYNGSVKITYTRSNLTNPSYSIFLFKKEDTAYTRTTNEIGTCCYGYDAKCFAGAEFYEIAGKTVENGRIRELALTKADNLEAGVPYIFFPNTMENDSRATKANPNIVIVCDKSETSEAQCRNGLHGVYVDTPISASDGLCVFSNNRIKLCGNNSGVKANRAYIDLDEIPVLDETNAAMRLIAVGNDDQEVNGIVNAAGSERLVRVYDMSGRSAKVCDAAKGLFILEFSDGKRLKVVRSR